MNRQLKQLRHITVRFLAVPVVMLCLLSGQQSFAAGIGYGDVFNTASVYTWWIDLMNASTDSNDITRISLDASTSTGTTPFYWASAQLSINSPIINQTVTISGTGTQHLLIDFTDGGGDGFNTGEYIRLNIIPDDLPQTSPLSIPNSEMLGVTARFEFSDSSIWTGVFSDVPPAPGSPLPNGLYTLQPVPLPGAIWLLGSGLVALLGMKRKQAR